MTTMSDEDMMQLSSRLTTLGDDNLMCVCINALWLRSQGEPVCFIQQCG